MQIIKSILTKNDCYLTWKKITVKGLMIHSVGRNQPRAEVFVNLGIGRVIVRMQFLKMRRNGQTKIKGIKYMMKKETKYIHLLAKNQWKTSPLTTHFSSK